MKIKVLSLKFYSFLRQQERLIEALNELGHEATGEVYAPGIIKKIDEPIIFITEEQGIDSFVRLCGMHHKKGLAWIDFFVTKRFSAVKMWQDRFRRWGGKIVPIGNFEKEHLEMAKIQTDGVIPRCIPDNLFDYHWRGEKKRVLGWGFAHYMKEYNWYKHFGAPIELKDVTRKGHEFLVKFAENNPDWEVCLVTEREALEKAIKIPELSNLEIHEAGGFTEEEQREFFLNAGLFCFPTRQDSQGLVISEAQAMGVPTCYTRAPQQLEVGGGLEIPYKEIVKFPDHFRLAIIDYKDVEEAIYKTYSLSSYLSEHGRENAKRFRASVIAKQLVEVLG